MQTDNGHSLKNSWKDLGNNIFAGHFLSNSPALGYNSSQVYVKKYSSLANDPISKTTIFLLHDIGQYHGRFQSFINWAQKENPNITFVAMDFIGHGLSSGTRGHFDKLEYLVDDFHYLLNQFDKNSENNEKWHVLGHGLGGLVALDYLNRYQDSVENKIDGVILSNFILKFDSLFLQFEDQTLIQKMGLNKVLDHIRPLRVLKGDQQLSNAEDVLNYEQDPLVVHRPTLASIKEIKKKIINIYQDSYFLSKPLMLLKSDLSSKKTNDSISYFSKGVKKELLTQKKYSIMKHDLYNDKEREIVFADILNWMKSYEN